MANKSVKKSVKKVAGKAKMAARAAGAVRRNTSAPAPSVTTLRPGVAALPVGQQAAGGVLPGQVEDSFALVDVMALRPLAPVAA